MANKPTRKLKPKSDPEEYKRFLETARKVGASENPKDFDKAFKEAVSHKSRTKGHRAS